MENTISKKHYARMFKEGSITRKLICEMYGIPKNTLSDHINDLKKEGLISGTKRCIKSSDNKSYNTEVYSNHEALIILNRLTHRIKRTKNKRGSVYALIDDGDYIKIGFTSNFDERFKSIKSCNPSVRLLGKIDQCGKNIESFYHKLFKAYRVSGEWFKDSTGYLKEFLLNDIEIRNLQNQLKAL